MKVQPRVTASCQCSIRARIWLPSPSACLGVNPRVQRSFFPGFTRQLRSFGHEPPVAACISAPIGVQSSASRWRGDWNFSPRASSTDLFTAEMWIGRDDCTDLVGGEGVSVKFRFGKIALPGSRYVKVLRSSSAASGSDTFAREFSSRGNNIGNDIGGCGCGDEIVENFRAVRAKSKMMHAAKIATEMEVNLVGTFIWRCFRTFPSLFEILR